MTISMTTSTLRSAAKQEGRSRSLLLVRCAAGLAALLALGGCAEPMTDGDGIDDLEDGATGEAAAAISAFGYVSLSPPGNDGASVDLGPDSDRTCFLQGVTGELKGAQGGTEGSVKVRRQNGHWWLETHYGNGSGVKGYAACIPVTNNRQNIAWFGNTEDGPNTSFLPEESVNASTQCFLTGVAATTGFMHEDAVVKLAKEHIFTADGGFDSWVFRGWLVEEQDGSRGGHAEGVCVDFVSLYSLYTFQSASGSSGASTLLAPVSGNACGVTMLAGQFAAANHGVDDGAKIYPQIAVGGGQWRAFSSSAKTIQGYCHSDLALPF